MNIFATSECPITSASALDDVRVRKMIIESAQLLSFALIINKDPQATFAMKESKSHMKHRCAIWAATSMTNYEWLYRHYQALVQIDTTIRNKIHASARFMEVLSPSNITTIPKLPLTEFANCASNLAYDIDMTHISPVTKAYQEYLIARWGREISIGRFPKWTNRQHPSFCNHLQLTKFLIYKR